MLLSYLKVGIIGFGGGSALIPVIEAEIVAKKRLLSPEEYNRHVILANITPGALPVKLAAAGGDAAAGPLGMVSAAVAVSFPGVAATLLLVCLLSQMGEGVLRQIRYCAFGIAVFIVLLLLHYIVRTLQKGRADGMAAAGPAVMIAVFLLTAGKELRQLFGIGGSAIFDLSTIHMLLLAFFLIFSLGAGFTKGRVALAALLSLLFLLCTGKAGLCPVRWVRYVVFASMLLLAGCGLLRDKAIHPGSAAAEAAGSAAATVRRLFVWLCFALLCSLPALLLCPGAAGYLRTGALSAVMSFGGGEAYLTVADGMFLSSGMLTREEFYSRLLPVANALPGPILSKLLAGIGYFFGFAETASIPLALLTAFAGYSISLAASNVVFFLVQEIYSRFEGLSVFRNLSRWILPVICGLLLTTIVSMVQENLSIAALAGGSSVAAAAFSLLLLAAAFGLKRRLSDVPVLLLCGAAAMAFWNLPIF